MTSLRARLSLFLVAGFAVMVALVGYWVFAAVQHSATGELDANLEWRAQQLAALIDVEDGVIEFDYEPRFQPEFERELQGAHFEIWLDDGQLLLRSRHLHQPLLPAAGRADVAPHDLVLEDGRCVRVIAVLVDPTVGVGEAVPAGLTDIAAAPLARPAQAERDAAAPPRLVLAVAIGRERLDALLATILRTTLLAGGASVLLAAGFVWRSVGRGLSPVREVARQVGRLSADRLSERIAPRWTPAELVPIVEQVNALLVRIETAMQRERRFAGNVAHELRTPVAELRTLAQVAGRWPDDEQAVRGFFADVDGVARRMQAVIGNMLILARCASGREPMATAPVALRPLLLASWRRQAQAADRRRLQFEAAVEPAVVVDSDPDKLAMIFDNLIGNAISYATAGSTIVARFDDARAVLELANRAELLSAQAMHKLTEPFWRHDESRSAPQHAGLGLSVVQALTERLGLTATFAQDESGHFRVGLTGWRRCSMPDDVQPGKVAGERPPTTGEA